MTGEQNFGGDWTEKKLVKVKKYLPAFTTIMKRHFKHYEYIDAFAGTGQRDIDTPGCDANPLLKEFVSLDDDAASYAVGSARIALETNLPFTKYIFIEKSKCRFELLRNLKNDFPDKAGIIEFVNDEANDCLVNLCRKTDWRSRRAVMFLDPFGMQVTWKTLTAIAQTEAIDLWYLFPLGVGVNRLLKKNIAEIPPDWADKLDDTFGSKEWRTAFYKKDKQRSLFTRDDSIVKNTDFDEISHFFIRRLKSVFAGVAENPLVLRNSKNNPIYLLCFAAGNPKGAPTAVRIARHILGK